MLKQKKERGSYIKTPNVINANGGSGLEKITLGNVELIHHKFILLMSEIDQVIFQHHAKKIFAANLSQRSNQKRGKGMELKYILFIIAGSAFGTFCACWIYGLIMDWHDMQWRNLVRGQIRLKHEKEEFLKEKEQPKCES